MALIVDERVDLTFLNVKLKNATNDDKDDCGSA